MCGLAGYVDFSGASPPGILGQMVDLLRRRGPDDEGTFVDGPCGLAHTRLSIIDRAGGAQPMVLHERRFALAYNGEIYNAPELRAALASNGRFTTRTDTEVVLRGVAHEGAGFLPRLEGMFALAAWDGARRTLLLARDPIGEKPLYYAQPRLGLIVFGSEIQAVLLHPEVDAGLDEAALAQVLRFRGTYDGSTLHRGVREIEPGTALEFGAEGTATHRFHDFIASVASARAAQADLSDAQLSRRGRELFETSVRRQLVADEPVGVFLSGGLDSSLVAAATRRIGGPDATVRTFSVGFAGDPMNEQPFAAIVADQIGSVHEPITVDWTDVAERLPTLSACRGAPLGEVAELAIAKMSGVARGSVKVVLSGEGADEIFGGYPKYMTARLPPWVRTGAQLAGPDLLDAVARTIGVSARRAAPAIRAMIQPGELDHVAQWFSHADRAGLAGLWPDLDWSDAGWAATMQRHAAVLDRCRGESRLTRMQLVDCLTWLPGNILPQGDRMSMAESLETRSPFLDPALAAFALALPDRLKIRGTTAKRMLRDWAGDMLPPTIARRRKNGFRAPVGGWFRGPLKAMLEDYLWEPSGLCATFGDSKRAAELIQLHASGRIDAGGLLWSLLAAEVWYRHVFLAPPANGGAARSRDAASLLDA